MNIYIAVLLVGQLVTILTILVGVAKVFRGAATVDMNANISAVRALAEAESRFRTDLLLQIGRLQARADECEKHHEQCEKNVEKLKRMYFHPVELEKDSVPL